MNIQNIFTRRQYNPEEQTFCLFGKFGTARTMREMSLRLAMGDYSDIQNPYITGVGVWEPWTLVRNLRTHEGLALELDSVPHGVRSTARDDAEKKVYHLFAAGERHYYWNSDWVHRFCNQIIMPLSTKEVTVIDGHPTFGDPHQWYAMYTEKEMRKMKQHYAKYRYRLQNLRYSPDELQHLCIQLALGQLPHEYMYYYDGNSHHLISSKVPEIPVEGAEIIAKPTDRVIAVYHEGVWHLKCTADISSNEKAITADILMYIGRRPVRTVRI